MSRLVDRSVNPRSRELGDILEAYNAVTERLEQSHHRLTGEVERLRGQLAEKDRELSRKERLAALGEMAAGVAHEVRNPLAAIQLYASVLHRDLEDMPELRQTVRKIGSAVKTLDGLVSDILAFAGTGPLDARPVQLGGVVEEVLALAAPQADALRAQINVDESASRTSLSADEKALTRALVNLVFNALDAAGADGTVWVSVVDAGPGQAGIAVADNGPGVAPDLAQRIFNPFFTTKETGTGLGLSIVHSIAEAHGGRVEVRPRDGGGAVFTLVMPRAEVPDGVLSGEN